MKIMSAREAKNGFGLMIDSARAEPVLIEKIPNGSESELALRHLEVLLAFGIQMLLFMSLVTESMIG